MMTMAERRAAAAARIKDMAAAAAKTETPRAKRDTSLLPRIRVVAGAALEVVMAALKVAKLTAMWQQSTAKEHVVGSTCPHCQGTGRYRLHTKPGSNDKCYRCHGKGTLDAKDLAYLNRRMGGAGPVCWVISAPAA